MLKSKRIIQELNANIKKDLEPVIPEGYRKKVIDEAKKEMESWKKQLVEGNQLIQGNINYKIRAQKGYLTRLLKAEEDISKVKEAEQKLNTLQTFRDVILANIDESKSTIRKFSGDFKEVEVGGYGKMFYNKEELMASKNPAFMILKDQAKWLKKELTKPFAGLMGEKQKRGLTIQYQKVLATLESMNTGTEFSEILKDDEKGLYEDLIDYIEENKIKHNEYAVMYESGTVGSILLF